MTYVQNIKSTEISIEFEFLHRMAIRGRLNDSKLSEIITHTYLGEEVKWRVVFIPKKTKDTVALYVELISPEKVELPRCFKFAILDDNYEEVHVKETAPRRCDKSIKKLYGWKVFIARDELFGTRRFNYLNRSTIRIACKITVCTLLPEDAQNRLVKDFAKMVNGKLTDVEFTFGEQKITAHKCILGARSTVFDAMFEHDFEEKKTNSVAITDISYETFLNMINYIYTETWKELTHEAKIELLIAADKYDLKTLKDICVKSVLEMLLIENCLSTLIMADRHNCPELKESAVKFTKRNFKQIVLTEEWAEFRRCNPNIVDEVLQYVLPDAIP